MEVPSLPRVRLLTIGGRLGTLFSESEGDPGMTSGGTAPTVRVVSWRVVDGAREMPRRGSISWSACPANLY
jgi:hypothetical protein